MLKMYLVVGGVEMFERFRAVCLSRVRKALSQLMFFSYGVDRILIFQCFIACAIKHKQIYLRKNINVVTHGQISFITV